MTEAPETVAALFAGSAAAFSRLPLPAEAREAVRQELGALDRMLLEEGVFGDLLAALYEAIELPLEDILRSAWSSLIELQEYRDAQKHPPEETSTVRFGRHKVTSKHRPAVTLLLNDRTLASLTFDLVLTLNVTATTLKVRGGRIWQARGTEFQGEAALSYRGFALMKKKTGKLALPGTIDFKDGVAIPALPKAVG
ncbi:MAG: hypothetical protein Kow00114_19650 [Kiloniellaceae bacterium]